MPIPKDQLEPYAKLKEELTRLYRAFRITRDISSSVQDREELIQRRIHLNDTNVGFYTELTEMRTILDESHWRILDSLVDEVFYYVIELEHIANIEINDERIIRQSSLNGLEENLDIRFLEAEYTIRRFLLGFSFKAWREMRKIKSRCK